MNESEIKQIQADNKQNQSQAREVHPGTGVPAFDADNMATEEIKKLIGQLEKALGKKEAKRKKALEQIVALCHEHGITGRDVESALGSGR